MPVGSTAYPSKTKKPTGIQNVKKFPKKIDHHGIIDLTELDKIDYRPHTQMDNPNDHEMEVDNENIIDYWRMLPKAEFTTFNLIYYFWYKSLINMRK